MTESTYRSLMIKLGDFAKELQTSEIREDMQLDRTMIQFKIREISGYLRQMREITDVHENPEGKVIVEYSKKETPNGSGIIKA